MNYARQEERTRRGILSDSLLSAVIAIAYRDPIVHTPALVYRRPRANSTTFHHVVAMSARLRAKITIIFYARLSIDAKEHSERKRSIGASSSNLRIILAKRNDVSTKWFIFRSNVRFLRNPGSYRSNILNQRRRIPKQEFGKLKWKTFGNLSRKFGQRKILILKSGIFKSQILD